MFYLIIRRCRDPHLKHPRPNGLNNFTQTLSISYNPTKWHIRLHRPPQRSLRILRQIINFMNYDNLKRLLLFLIELLTASNLLYQLANNNLIMIIGFTRSNLNVIIG